MGKTELALVDIHKYNKKYNMRSLNPIVRITGLYVLSQNPLNERFGVETQKLSLTHSHVSKRISSDMLPQPPVVLI